MKGKIDQILYEWWIKFRSHKCYSYEAIGGASAAIAALLEDEQAIIETVWITKCVKLEARLAQMGQVLLDCKAYIELCCIPSRTVALEDEERLLNRIQALTAAGKKVENG